MDDLFTDSEGRTRFTRFRIERDPNGPVLEKDKGPVGLRTPNGLIWAHFLDELFYIPRVPSVPNYVTTWSRSMLKALGEHYDEIEAEMWDSPLVPPRVRRPWPVLKLPLAHPAQPDPPLGALDEGCEFEHSDFMCYAIRAGDNRNGVVTVYKQLVPRRCPEPPTACTGRMVRNDGQLSGGKPIGDPPYDFVWCEHFKERLEALGSGEAEELIAKAVIEMKAEGLVADTTGIREHCCLVRYSRPPNGRPGVPAESAAKRKEGLPDGARKKSSAPSTSAASTSSTSTARPPTEATVRDEEAASGKHEKNDEAVAGEELDNPGNPEGRQEASPRSAAQHPDVQPQPEGDVQMEDAASEATPAPDMFSVDGLPKLEEFIPTAFLPDTLLVHDPDRVTRHTRSTDQPVQYRRVLHRPPGKGKTACWVAAEPRPSEERVAHLHLRSTNRLGSGHHSDVYRSPLTLPPPLSAHSPTGQVTVAAKLAFAQCTAHTLLHNEGRAYGTFPVHMQEEYCGFNIVPPCRFAVPVGPVVPKFYGFYLPVGEDGEVVWDEDEAARHSNCDQDEPCRVKWLSPILLMEECGEPVRPEKFTVDQRTECFSLILRLHAQAITQGSFYVRNIMIQPGPLSFPPARRTFDCPSFRIIDFGRARCLSLLWAGVGDKETRARILGDLHATMWEEEKQAREQLLIDDPGSSMYCRFESTRHASAPVSMDGGNNQGKSGGWLGGLGEKMNQIAGGGTAGEAKEDKLDKSIDWVQEHVLGQGQQNNESAAEQFKDEQISDFIRNQYKSVTGSDFPVKDK
ncbi:hypothetical protein OH77DRAFT_1450242 [Trametes cingulata]|nr:hypothetical protein OH77DRAFT_1450242 [Trametes cingulata]